MLFITNIFNKRIHFSNNNDKQYYKNGAVKFLGVDTISSEILKTPKFRVNLDLKPLKINIR